MGWLFRSNIEAELQSGQLECVLEPYSLKRPAYYLYFPKANARLEELNAQLQTAYARWEELDAV